MLEPARESAMITALGLTSFPCSRRLNRFKVQGKAHAMTVVDLDVSAYSALGQFSKMIGVFVQINQKRLL